MSESFLIAGGAGYIGSHIAKYVQRAGVEPVVLDSLITGNRSSVRFGPFYEGQMEDRILVRSIVEKHDIRAVILLAAHAYVGESVQNPRKYYRNNISASLEFLEALIVAGVRRVIFSSSCSIYGNQTVPRISEDCPMNPLSPYAETKYFLERALRAYRQAEGLETVCLRYFNAAGADPEGELGEEHDPETHLIPLAIRSALGYDPLLVFGTDYPTRDGTAVRDYIHVSDLADAHVRAAQYLAKGGASTEINLGTGRGHSVREVIDAVEKISGRNVRTINNPRREGDAPSLIADASRAKGALGWEPQYSTLEAIVSTAWNWSARKHGVGPRKEL